MGFCPSVEQIEQTEAKPLGEDLGLGFLESFSSKEDITRCEWPRGVLGMDHLVLGLCFVIVNPFENMFSPAGCWATACVPSSSLTFERMNSSYDGCPQGWQPGCPSILTRDKDASG